ncbi:MAG: primosomal protein N' [Bacteroidales bacterium]|nr:primosomal protein N' [Bacteroidales bacterium]
MTLFVEVLLPLPLAKSFTYRLPFDYNDYAEVGKRVVVQFGKKKLYSGIIVEIHQRIPESSSIKYILNILDDRPIVNSYQLKFWYWLSDYYMAHRGEIMNAALPSALKMASESKLVLHPDFDKNYEALNEKEFLIIQALELNSEITLTEVSKIVEMQKIMPLVKTLIEKSCVLPQEEIKNKFRPKMESYVSFSEKYTKIEHIESLTIELEKKAPKQLELLMSFIQLSSFLSKNKKEVSKSVLLKKSNISSSILSSLIDKGVLEIYKKSQSRIKDFASIKSVDSIKLSEAQDIARNQIEDSFKEKDVCLLHGVTGSGKTEIYIKIIEKYLAKNKQVLFLIPEIALTAQIINRLRQYFGEKLGYYHSRYGNNERVEVWHRVAQETDRQYKIIIGARSSVFLPFTDLGLVIVDEEHDTSYKQFDPSPRYQARDAAIVLAKMHGAKTLLGSATPSIETYYKSRKGKYGLVELKERFAKINMPIIEVVDVVEARKKKEMNSHLSKYLIDNITEALENKEQVILFQNRRGFSLRLVCDSCQWTPECNNCDVSLTYHKGLNRLKCHYCGASKDVPVECPNCASKKLSMRGFGTEKVEEEMPIFFPNATVKRMDLDTTRSKNAYLQIINDFQDRKIDILVGTQMVTKGLDFDNVSLVGVLNADNGLFYPDFRAFERSFQQLTQVAGRSGRKHKRGKVIIQTSQPYHAVIRDVVANDYLGMYKSQMEERANFKYPPFYRIIRISLKHKDYNVLNGGAEHFANLLKPQLGARVLGPEYPMVARVKNYFIKNILIKFEIEASHVAVKKIIIDAMDAMYKVKKFRSIFIQPDVDPM